jgi:dTDP-4-amino-4,6-dideoxygalactose transaminase
MSQVKPHQAASQIPFIDLQAQRRRIGSQIETAIARVLDHGQFIMGPEIARLEAMLAEFAGTAHAVTCASGTDALLLPMMARGIGKGDAVFVPAFNFVAAAEVSAVLGATPVFVDVCEDDYCLSPESLRTAIADARALGLRPAAVVAVDLYGQIADYPAISTVAEEAGLFVIEDAAQSFGAWLGGIRAGSFGNVAGTSFFPAKPLGCYGDGGAIFTSDEELAGRLRLLRVHGQGARKYQYEDIGLNARFDTLQAAILIEKLAIFEDEIVARDRIAARYTAALSGIATTPRPRAGATSVWAQYTLRVKNRDEVAKCMGEDGIPTAVHYPVPLTEQPPYRRFPVVSSGVPVSARVAAEVLCLPMHPYLSETDQDRVVESLRRALNASSAP